MWIRCCLEPSGGNHWAPLQAADTLKAGPARPPRRTADSLGDAALLQARYEKFRRMGQVLEGAAANPANAT